MDTPVLTQLDLKRNLDNFKSNLVMKISCFVMNILASDCFEKDYKWGISTNFCVKK